MTRNIPAAAASHLDADALRCIEFILEMDKMKSIKRRSPLLDNSRVETDAEHSWQVAMIALVLSHHAPADVRIDRVIKMMLIHDIVEIDAGDTFLYDAKAGQSQDEREEKAAERLFGMLPEALCLELTALWREFEEGQSPDARFAKGIDRLQPLLLNYFSGGGTWNMPGVHRDEVLRRKKVIAGISETFWNFGEALIEDGADRGWLRRSPAFKRADTARDDQAAPEKAPSLDGIATFPVSQAPDAMVAVAREFEERYGRPFRTLTRISEGLLNALHRDREPEEGPLDGPAFALSVASGFDETVAGHIDTLSRIANSDTVTRAENVAFFDAVLKIYEKLPGGLRYLSAQHDTFCIGPEREGRIIAETLGCLPATRSDTPNAKRMPEKSGLIVGLDIAPIVGPFERCVIIDGAIASGSTLIALIESLRNRFSEFHVFSAHATASSLRALSRYASGSGIRLAVNVGHVSGVLNKKRYALHADGSLVIGDLGDLISPAVQ